MTKFYEREDTEPQEKTGGKGARGRDLASPPTVNSEDFHLAGRLCALNAPCPQARPHPLPALPLPGQSPFFVSLEVITWSSGALLLRLRRWFKALQTQFIIVCLMCDVCLMCASVA